jgi:hypothetical protein
MADAEKVTTEPEPEAQQPAERQFSEHERRLQGVFFSAQYAQQPELVAMLETKRANLRLLQVEIAVLEVFVSARCS